PSRGVGVLLADRLRRDEAVAELCRERGDDRLDRGGIASRHRIGLLLRQSHCQLTSGAQFNATAPAKHLLQRLRNVPQARRSATPSGALRGLRSRISGAPAPLCFGLRRAAPYAAATKLASLRRA